MSFVSRTNFIVKCQQLIRLWFALLAVDGLPAVDISGDANLAPSAPNIARIFKAVRFKKYLALCV